MVDKNPQNGQVYKVPDGIDDKTPNFTTPLHVKGKPEASKEKAGFEPPPGPSEADN